MSDVRAAVNTGLDGVSMYMATSAALRKHSHGKGVAAVIETASEVIQYVSGKSGDPREGRSGKDGECTDKRRTLTVSSSLFLTQVREGSGHGGALQLRRHFPQRPRRAA